MQDFKKFKRAYSKQRKNAKNRGIGWLLTFDEWLAWWGDDIYKRGKGRDNLQMQRFHDKGPYEIGNIKKGTPADNVKTSANVARTRRCEQAKREHEAALDALMWAPSAEPLDPGPKGRKYQIGLLARGAYHGNVAFPIDR